MNHLLYDVWRDDDITKCYFPWAAQLVSHVAHFATQAAAENYVASVQKHRKEKGLT
jgi:hypothetical protein